MNQEAMMYKIIEANLKFDKDGRLEKIITTAEMPCNPSDVRKIEARAKNPYWTSNFLKWDAVLQVILQDTTGHGSEID